MEDSTLSWRAREHEHIHRESDWYWALGIIAVCCALTSVIFSNILFALLIVIGAITLGLVARREIEEVQFVLNEKGLFVGEEFYSFKEMQGFWIEEGAEEARLLVDTPRWMAPDTIVPIHPEDVEAIRSFFQTAGVKEKEMYEPFAYRVLEFFGF